MIPHHSLSIAQLRWQFSKINPFSKRKTSSIFQALCFLIPKKVRWLDISQTNTVYLYIFVFFQLPEAVFWRGYKSWTVICETSFLDIPHPYSNKHVYMICMYVFCLTRLFSHNKKKDRSVVTFFAVAPVMSRGFAPRNQGPLEGFKRDGRLQR